MQIGIPPSRYLAEWDEADKAMVNAYLNYKADLHTCGRPLSESLFDPDVPPEDRPDYVVGTQTCLGCQAEDKRRAELAAEHQALSDAGRHPDSWLLTTVYRLDEMPEADRQAVLQERSSAESRRRQQRRAPENPPQIQYTDPPSS